MLEPFSKKRRLLRDRTADNDFIAPSLTLDNLERYHTRESIYRALSENLTDFRGTLLDIGCGVMPYKSFILDKSAVSQYFGLDFQEGIYAQMQAPDITWDGKHIPLANNSVDCIMATEVLEHCPEPELVMREAFRVLQVGGNFFFTVPFLWPLHNVPHDEYRYTPFSLKRHLHNAGFGHISLRAFGGWNASVAQILGLWARRRTTSSMKRGLSSLCIFPLVYIFLKRDRPPQEFHNNTMVTGFYGMVSKGGINTE